jgi:hypothetical protein
MDSETYKVVYSTRSEGKSQKDAVKNFKKEQKEIRAKYIDEGGFILGVKRICKSSFQ